jgi:chemotaxis protein MotB
MSKKPLPISEGGAPEWMVSYADMITIVLAFFVVLYSTTSGIGSNDHGHDTANTGYKHGNRAGAEDVALEGKDLVKLRKVMNSLNERFGPSWTLSNCWAGGPIATQNRNERKDLQDIRGFRGGQDGGNSSLTVPVTKNYDYTIPGGRIFFEESSATLDISQQIELDLVAEDLAGKLQKIELRGHASRRPLPKNAPWKNAWELAFARCQAVASYLAARGIDPRRMRLSIAADNEPLNVVVNPPYGEKNSRVEIRLLNEWFNNNNNLQGRFVPAPPTAKPQAAKEPAEPSVKPSEKEALAP